MSKKAVISGIIRSSGKRTNRIINCCRVICRYRTMAEPSVHHALIVIFLEFFAWGLLTSPMITILNVTFPEETFLMNGLIMGIKGFLSFLSAPVIGALSDIWGRKSFLLITVAFTCSPIPFMAVNSFWYFAMIAISGLFAVTFSVVFAYVSDITSESERSAAFGLVSATFAASLVTSPALGAYLSHLYGDTFVVVIATLIAALDVAYIFFLVPESLPDKLRQTNSISSNTSGARIIPWWENMDPFSSLKTVGKDPLILKLCVAVFLSYLPEAGQYSCFFVYLRLVIGFSPEDVALFIAVLGLLSVIAQTIVLATFMRIFNSRMTIMIGLGFQAIQLLCYGFGSSSGMMWFAGILASFSSISYPAISSYISTYADADKQGLVQGMITGIRGLCNGLGPALFGLIFNLFHVDLNKEVMTSQHPVAGVISSALNRTSLLSPSSSSSSVITHDHKSTLPFIPGPPFVFGSLMVMLAILAAYFIPQITTYKPNNNYNSSSNHNSSSNEYYYTHVDLSVPKDDSWKKEDEERRKKKHDDDEEEEDEDNNQDKVEFERPSNHKRSSSIHQRVSQSDDANNVTKSDNGQAAMGIPTVVRVKSTRFRTSKPGATCELDIPLLDESEPL